MSMYRLIPWEWLCIAHFCCTATRRDAWIVNSGCQTFIHSLGALLNWQHSPSECIAQSSCLKWRKTIKSLRIWVTWRIFSLNKVDQVKLEPFEDSVNLVWLEDHNIWSSRRQTLVTSIRMTNNKKKETNRSDDWITIEIQVKIFTEKGNKKHGDNKASRQMKICVFSSVQSYLWKKNKSI